MNFLYNYNLYFLLDMLLKINVCNNFQFNGIFEYNAYDIKHSRIHIIINISFKRPDLVYK